jgi:hypothetical protein
MDKHDASGADSGNDVAPVVADLLAGPSVKLSDTEINGVGGVVVQGVRDEARAGLHEHLSPAAVAEMDRSQVAAAAARPAVRPVNRQPPRKVPSRAL